MEYTLAGQFLEACDCTVICPCWVDDDPVGGHCTGFILWEFRKVNGKDSTITDDNGDLHTVTGCKVVNVATHSGKRRASTAPTTSVVYIDVSAQGDETKLFDALSSAFAEHPKKPAGSGPLAELADVSGTVVGIEPAKIDFQVHEHEKDTDAWTVTVARKELMQKEDHAGQPEPLLIKATGHPKRFDEEDLPDAKPLALTYTALSYELQAQGSVTAQQGEELSINVGALPGGSLEVTGRSGMRGTFMYEHSDPPHANVGAAGQEHAK